MPLASAVEASIMATFAFALVVLLLELGTARRGSSIWFGSRRFLPCGFLSIAIPFRVVLILILIDPFTICFLLISIPPIIAVVLVVVLVVLIVLVVGLVRIVPPTVLVLAVEDVLVVLLVGCDPESKGTSIIEPREVSVDLQLDVVYGL